MEFNWAKNIDFDTVCQVVVGIAAAGWAIATFVHVNRRELAWKKTEFIVNELKYLDTDEEMRECTLIILGRHPTISVDDFLKAESVEGRGDDAVNLLLLKMDKYLNFLWRIAYAYLVLKSLKKRDIAAFGAYFDAVGSHPKLRDYCAKGPSGTSEDAPYPEIIEANEHL